MSTSIIKHVTISKLWGVKTISTDFDEHINIFIGINGSSKTTFLNLIEATLLVDLRVFYSVDFEYVKIDLNGTDIQYVKVIKQEKDGEFFISYFFDDKDPINIPCPEIMLQRSYRIPMRYRETYSFVKEQMKNLVNISWLSVNRDNIDISDYDRHDFERFNNTVDIKLQELVKKLLVYQLQLESDVNRDSSKFKEEVLSLMLYNPLFDDIDYKNLDFFEKTDMSSMQQDLYNAFNKLGVADDKKNLIQNHIKKIKTAISKISKGNFAREDIFVLGLINRTVSIIKISKEHEISETTIFAPLTQFWKRLKDFMPNKEFLLNKEGDGELVIKISEGENQKRLINIASLSSGEKQLFILLIEALLQNKSPQLFIADEPELSLHIDWQRKILKSLLELNPKAQIIVATHSPEIASKFPNNIINMSKITEYE